MMHDPKFHSRMIARLLAAAMSLATAAAWAGPANDLRDLVSARGAGSERGLDRRGYTRIDTYTSRNLDMSYWWSSAQRSCIRLTTREGRNQALIDVDPSDCGQTRREDGRREGASVAAGAAELLGVNTLLHKSHHRNDRNFNEQQAADFERGYRDGLFNNGLTQPGDRGEYRDGYDQGAIERRQQLNYRPGNVAVNSGPRWTYCAAEGEFCRVNGAARVRYGADNRYEYRNVFGGIPCSVQQFGDPAYGINKTCETMSHGKGYASVNHGSNWEYCGSEGGYCSFNGTGEVRYGVNGKFVVQSATNGMPCDVGTFGKDPAYGQDKHCFVRKVGR